MPTVTKIGNLHREDDLSMERYNVAVTPGESNPVDILSEQIAYLTAVEGPCLFTIKSDEKTARIFGYPAALDADIDSNGVTGLDDLSFDASLFTALIPIEYTIRISSAAASPDEFKVSEDGGAEGSAIPITAGVAQAIGSDGAKILFVAGDGHTLDDTWIVTFFPATSSFTVKLVGYGG